jgi:hypothetical protein
MRIFLILAVLMAMGSVAAAQAGTPQTSKSAQGAAKKPATPAKKSPAGGSQSVITIENLCPARQPKPTPCKTVITKDEFERIMNAIRPNLPPGARMQLAQSYAELLTFAAQAEKAGLDKTPEFQEQIKLRRLQSLAMAYNRYLQEKYAKPSEAELEKFYNENKPAYEEITLKRMHIPKPISSGEKKPAMDEAATKAMAERTRERAAAGEDFDKLQQEAIAAVNPEAAKTAAPPTSIGPRRRGTLPPPQEAQIFELAAGQVSPLFDERYGFFIYKVESKRVVPLAEVKTQIARQLEEQKMRDAVEKTISLVKTTFEQNYFKPPEPAQAPAAAPATPAPAAPAPTAGADKEAPKQEPPAATPPSPPPQQQQTPPPIGSAPTAPPK